MIKLLRVDEKDVKGLLDGERRRKFSGKDNIRVLFLSYV